MEVNGLFPPRFGLPGGQIDQAEVIKEFDAQLDYLTRLGLTISYFDTHMLLELYGRYQRCLKSKTPIQVHQELLMAA
ncbi:ChbG/HpnK family deacetylase [Enterococcus casseliflavus]|uniref:ChbG/HpnK family deacetylase n=1 Tax=Enterococcus casseliflavus TaxID=37734 RepID=UPI0034D19F28